MGRLAKLVEKRGFDLSVVSKYKSQLYGFATIWVMISHAFDYSIFRLESLGEIGYILRILGAHGNIGVDVFLFLSGVSLYFSYHKKRDTEVFIKRRLKRIVLPFLLVVGSIGILQVILSESMKITDLVLNISTLGIWINGSRYSPWYISCILPFYFLYPYIYTLFFPKDTPISERQRLLRLIVLLAFVYYGCFLLYMYNYEYFKMVEIIIFRFPIFILGSYFGKYVYEKKEVSKSFLLVLLISYLLYFYIRNYRVVDGTYYASYILGGISITYIAAIFFKWLNSSKNIVLKHVNIFFSFIGGISLEVYLTHSMYFHFIEWSGGRYSMPNHWQWLLAMVASFILSIYISRLTNAIYNRMAKNCA